MSPFIKTRLIQIGNSQGIRIPKTILEELKLSQDIELEVRDDHLVIRSGTRPRAGWAEQFQLMAERGDDGLLDPEIMLTEWEKSEWEW
ncbi:MAG: AbrB/MazE/SpoVT family DNA-binding domain-containing protein [Candidatus Hydrogenedentes bacterium]|nr:AbrB/MazE/SpoVT family DNA-binding domain-containing protein [Candidatus Hydrogenedentota bacterium]